MPMSCYDQRNLLTMKSAQRHAKNWSNEIGICHLITAGPNRYAPSFHKICYQISDKGRICFSKSQFSRYPMVVKTLSVAL